MFGAQLIKIINQVLLVEPMVCHVCCMTCLSWKELFFLKEQKIDLIGSYFYCPVFVEQGVI